MVCRAEYSSLKLIGAGPAPSALNSEVSMGACGTRILKPLRSSGVLISRSDEVIWRKPLSHTRDTVMIGVLAICART